MQNMNIQQWYEETVSGDSQNTVADNAGIVPSSLYRQLPDRLSPQNVVKIARAYGVSVIDGLVALGLIDDSDLEKSASSDALRNATDEELLHELSIRMASGAEKRDPKWDEPITLTEEDMQEARQRNEETAVAETLQKQHRGDLDLAAHEDEHKYDGDGDEPA